MITINIVPISVLSVLMAITVIVTSYRRLKRNTITVGEFYFWLVLWVVIAFFALFPKTADVLAGVFGVEHGTELALFVAVLLLFWLHLRTALALERTERNITKIVREIALKDDQS